MVLSLLYGVEKIIIILRKNVVKYSIFSYFLCWFFLVSAQKVADKDDFVELTEFYGDFILDMKYATSDNFLRQKVYDCEKCYLRRNTALALIKVAKELKKYGYRIKIFDCYRPLDIQKKMWKILPGTDYVANPKKGSKHNRGVAVDLTLVDESNSEVDMGTPFDFFGKEAHHTYQGHSEEVKKNRKFLKDIMNKYNFRSIYSEWWHYEYRPERFSEIANFKWNCE